MRSILLVDDHLQAQRRMSGVLETVFPEAELSVASTFQTALREITKRPFDLAILDLSMPDGKGDNLIEPLKTQNPDCYIVVWSMHDQTSRLIEVLARGANGYLLKDQGIGELREALEGLPFGDPPLSASVTRRMIEYIQSTQSDVGRPTSSDRPVANAGGSSFDTLDAMTEREEEILGYLAKGFNRPDIAGILNISKSTVATHTANIYVKLRVSSRLEAVEVARKLGLHK